ncbi:MAG: hypothetical protein KGZ60_11675, partial [Truepera sp.]|nr:hypothetical protein [Truepera sp.]
TSLEDFVRYLKAEYLDASYLQQDAFHEVDGATSANRQRYVFSRLVRILRARLSFNDKDAARRFFQELTQLTKEWNRSPQGSPDFTRLEHQIAVLVEGLAPSQVEGSTAHV